MSNPITGRTEVELGGEVRVLACDMNAAAHLYESFGAHWTLWLLERFAGKPVTLEDGTKARKLEPLTPGELRGVLYALLATDRIDSRRVETEASVGALIPAFAVDELHLKAAACILVSFGVPGEAIEGGRRGVAAPHGSEHAAMSGTGTKS